MSTVFAQFSDSLADPNRLPVALAAVLLTSFAGAVSGPLDGNSNPLIWIAINRILGPLGDRLDRLHRTRIDLMFRGFLLTCFVLGLATALAGIVNKLILTMPYYKITEVFILAALLTSGTVWHGLWSLYSVMEDKKTAQGGFYSLSRSTRTNLALADDFSIARVAMGYSARAFDKGLVAPVFWYFIGGFPAAMVYAAVAALAWRFGKDGYSKGFGAVPLGMEKVLGFIPGLLAGVLIALAGAFTPTAGLTRGVLSFFGHKSRARYGQGGPPLSALAWSLNLMLGGPSQDLSGSALQGGWVGPDKATAKNDHTHLKRAIYISLMAHLLFAAGLGGAYLWAG